MKKLDLKQVFRDLYRARADDAVLVEVPRMKFLMVDGQGDPRAEDYQQAVAALYGVAYALKFMLKKARPPQDYTVMPLESLWWCQGKPFDLERRSDWRWTALILQPEFVTPRLVKDAVERVAARRANPALARVRADEFAEGPCVQMLHVGPYCEEARSIARMHAFLTANGYEPAGKHHEIYLGDPRRVAPEKLRTILRQPVRRAGAASAACA